MINKHLKPAFSSIRPPPNILELENHLEQKLTNSTMRIACNINPNVVYREGKP